MTRATQPKLQIGTLQAAFDSGDLTPEALLTLIYQRIAVLGVRPIWIEVVPQEAALTALQSARERKAKGENLPLFGVPFAVKDNIDIAGMPTSAGCPDFAYTPTQSNPVVKRLIEAGAILIGKTNMDQFATGLVGTRSPYGACSSVFNAKYISGGSSSGSALAVAQGLACFSLGTDTAGSGRIPAAFNELVGLKPTRGALSTRGVVPACRSLDCVSIFANSVGDAALLFDIVRAFDAADPFSRAAPTATVRVAGAFKFGVPQAGQLEFFGNSAYAKLFGQAVERCVRLGGTAVSVDLTAFLAAAELLYAGPWVAERYAAVGQFIEEHPGAVDPTVAKIILAGKNFSAADCFRAQHALAGLQQQAAAILREVDFLLLPTAPTSYTLQQVAEEPLQLNMNLGRYTNFVNLLDMSAVAVPAGFTDTGLSFGVTLMSAAWAEAALLQFAAQFCGEKPPAIAGNNEIILAVAGAHLSGQPLNHQLTSRGARLVQTCKTSGEYRLYALNTVPPKPGLVLSPGFAGAGIDVELWALTAEAFGSFVAEVPAPMTIGSVVLENGKTVKGFLCEPFALEGARDITHHGGWRAFLTPSR
ncbi:MAG TPA: allophanate hydrolase [Polyangiaceae bacterium]|nr:allophanate hydrolase [Polyangiaceae bacterium]